MIEFIKKMVFSSLKKALFLFVFFFVFLCIFFWFLFDFFLFLFFFFFFSFVRCPAAISLPCPTIHCFFYLSDYSLFFFFINGMLYACRLPILQLNFLSLKKNLFLFVFFFLFFCIFFWVYWIFLSFSFFHS